MKGKESVFLTGATGLVGSYLLKILLENGHRVYVLARSKDNKSAEDRVIDILRFWDKNIADKGILKKLNVIEGDIIYPGLGIKLKRDIEALISDVEVIFHSAAIVGFKIPLETIRGINVAGTRNVLDFALQCKEKGRLRKINHISTAYVMGTKNDIEFNEDALELGQGFYNTYEQSKYEAELLVKEYIKKGLNISIFRPSIVMGDCEEGKITEFRLFYQPLHFFYKQIYDEFPLGLGCTHNLVNVDTVAKAIFLLGEREESQVYNITSPDDTPVLFCLKSASDYFGFKLPKFIAPEEFDFKKWTPAQRALAEPYLPYFNYTVKFISQKTQGVLNQYDFRYPEMDKDNVNRNLTYCDRVGFIKKRT